MKRLAALLFASVLLLAGVTAAQAIPVPDPCDSIPVGANNTEAIRNSRTYDKCRFDRIEKQLDRIEAQTKPAPTPTPTPTPTPSVTATPTPSVTVVPTPTPTPTPTASEAPANPGTFALWHHRWEGPSLRAWPADVQASTNMIIVGIAQSASQSSPNGAIEYSPLNGQSVADHAADIRAAEARGTRVSVGFGGAGDSTAITTDAQVANFVASVDQIKTTYGITGVDVDLEPSGSAWTEAALTKALKQLETKYGPDFNVGVTVALYEPHTTKWLSLARALGSTMDYMAVMLYDFPESMDSRLTAVSLDKVRVMTNGGIPVEKQIMGYMQQPTSTYQASPPLVIKNAFAEVKRQHPKIKGAFIWEDKIQAAKAWEAARLLAPVARQ